MDLAKPDTIYRQLEEEFRDTALYRPMKVSRYEAGAELSCQVKGFTGSDEAYLKLLVQRFVGGGFAGQVYRVKVLDVAPEKAPPEGIVIGGVYAMKVLIPPTTFSRIFRNLIYWIAFQGPFQPQVNPDAARAGALWQKFIRRAARIRFGDERSIVDVYATFVDTNLGSCGELSEWVEGRTWRLEVDDRLDLLMRWRRGEQVDQGDLGSPEYRAKREFMDDIVRLMHEIGAHECARQYEWSTWKSQPNCLKRVDGDGSPSEGLVAVDFRAGLALLPFLPMSPGDFKLIGQGLMRGSLVQFDRGDLTALERFIGGSGDEFSDMSHQLKELRESERVYRDSLPDITHNHVRLLVSSQLWATVLEGAVTGWRVRNLVDSSFQERLRGSRAMTIIFLVLGLIPFLGKVLRRAWGQEDWRRHYAGMVTSRRYLNRSVRARIIEFLMSWRRSGRIEGARALVIARNPWRFCYHLPLAVMPARFHRFLTDWRYAKECIDYLVARPVRLYFNAEQREQWLCEMVAEGRGNKLVSHEDAGEILSQVGEPFIQKYLKSLAVHLCTLPVTQIVSVLVAVIYVAIHPELPRAQAWVIGLGIIALFQVVPISPGSLARGLYVLYLVIRERNFKDYNVAIFLGFFKYIGYLAFPIQMAYRYPTLARFMAGHWATEAVHVVPVFGERGALLEHKVFNLFYNWPLTIRRRARKRARMRADIEPRYWHIIVCAIGGAAIFSLADYVFLSNAGVLPRLMEIWALTALVPLLCGALVTLGAGGSELWKRVIGAAICGCAVGLFSTAFSGLMGYGEVIEYGTIAVRFAWRVFVFTILTSLGAMITELQLPEPEAK
ncbi:MAG: hypothetical protein JRF35_11540 [Deltaproteobacteria bacterium]|nr:hypothetical protein [Deltaproteobacteria bacterium]